MSSGFPTQPHPQQPYHGDPQGQGMPHPGQQIRRLTTEEMKVLKQCRRDCFFYRSLPFAAIGMLAVNQLGRRGVLKPSPLFGMYMKYTVAAAMGFFLGPASYWGTCLEKLKAVPNGELAAMLRQQGDKKRQFEVLQEVAVPDIGNVGSGTGSTSDQDYSSIREGSDMYTNPDFSVSGSGANAQQGGDQTPAKTTTSYDELRRRNREDYLRQQFGVGPSTSGQQPQQQQQQQQQPDNRQQQQQQSYDEQQKSRFNYGGPQGQQPTKTTKYGDLDFK